VVDGEAVRTVSGSRSYPVREGLIFMGYAVDDEAEIRETMEEERTWQGTPEHVERDEEFLRSSAPKAVEVVNLLRRLTGRREGLRALELGSGSGWVSWLLAEAGFDTWLSDFEANSLYSGWIYEHSRLQPGRRIVADARYAPFADESFDVVLLKEFAHHVADLGQLFGEANRVLRTGGLLAVIDPTRNVKTAINELRHPDPHKGHHITWADRYLLAARGAGFRKRWLTYTYHSQPSRSIVRSLQERAAGNVTGLRHNRSIFTAVHARVLGTASMVYVGEKLGAAPARPRPEFRQIDPATLQLAGSDISAWSGCRALVRQAAKQLV
jgi:SAM-dependent methyltransferase